MHRPAEPHRWQGREDAGEGPRAVRWHRQVTPLAPGAAPGVALLGFACDEGVRRNAGRVGAAEGPAALRRALAGLAWHVGRPVHDAGDVVVEEEALEEAQAELGAHVARLLGDGHLPIVMGGGHEVAYGSFLGLLAADAGRLGVVNLDAHLDLRAGRASSGTPFRQIAEACAARGRPFRYLCLGVDQAANTAALLDTAAGLGATFRRDRDCTPGRLEEVRAALAAFLGPVERVHLTVDLDALPAHVAPGVSAPAARGLALEVAEALVDDVLASGKLALFEVAELNPRLDLDGRTARVAARLVEQVARGP
ncbi:MAG: formimidoylglutamase [Anaeromyxobacter sp.]|nr:formimidoylglutamase [Anaeromyxobacter sp.]MBL0275106.1 formimidoylglutamase [Anaeromyxobacter sp.]